MHAPIDEPFLEADGTPEEPVAAADLKPGLAAHLPQWPIG